MLNGYSDLAYYATAPLGESVRTYVREHGLRGLGQAVSSDVAWSNLIGSYEWLNAHPLLEPQQINFGPAGAYQQAMVQYEAAMQARNLVIAALVAAQAKLQSQPDSGSTSPEYQQAAATYNSYKAAAYQQDMPSPFALALANIFGPGSFLDLAKLPGKIVVYGGAVLAAYVLLPQILKGVRGSKSA